MTTFDLILLIAIVAVLLDWLLAWRSSRRLANALAETVANIMDGNCPVGFTVRRDE